MITCRFWKKFNFEREEIEFEELIAIFINPLIDLLLLPFEAILVLIDLKIDNYIEKQNQEPMKKVNNGYLIKSIDILKKA